MADQGTDQGTDQGPRTKAQAQCTSGAPYTLPMRRLVRPLVVCALVWWCVTDRPPLVAQASRTIDPEFLAALRWRSIGPANTGGRIDDIAVARVPGQPDAIYVATASGGLFKSGNQGTTWTP